jgi:hypothetical protein
MRGVRISHSVAVSAALLLLLENQAIARFLQTDPVGYKDDIDLYTYTGNDPTDKTDPSGKDAIVIVQKNGDVNVIIPITYSGNAATPENIANFESAVSSTSQTVDGHQVTFTAVQGPSQIDSSVNNTMVMTDGPTTPAPSGEGNSGHSYVYAGTQGHVTMADVKGDAIVAPDGKTRSTSRKTGSSVEAHEAAGHMTGLEDNSTQGNLMGPGNGTTLTPSQVDAIKTQGGERHTVVNTVVNCAGSASSPGCSK